MFVTQTNWYLNVLKGYFYEHGVDHLTADVFRFYSKLKCNFQPSGHVSNLSYELVISFIFIRKISTGIKTCNALT